MRHWFLIICTLLFCISSVCAQDTNATNNINNLNNDMGQISVVNDVNTTENIGQISHPENIVFNKIISIF